MQRFVCIHGHFYQPPRENPWLEAIELQDSAAPYHDWNERIAAECYAPNATARILDGEGRISEIVNNYARISFNFGPTLLAWMKDKMPEIHEAIVAADRLSRERYSGHGSALAQVYNHLILPLANERDKYTQVFWGVRDFEFRFGRKPEGMWLSETAADTPALETLAKLGIRFTLLSPSQASKFREKGKRAWRDVNGARIDPTRPYLVALPSGRTMTIFFYDAPVSQAVAFEKLLSSGEQLAGRLMSAFDDSRQRDQLVHIATDGESYGHHHRYGEMALAYALSFIEKERLAQLTNYGEYLEKHPPTHEVRIHEKSAWSCSHGVGRWMSDCGCNTGGHGGWNQHWRTPLRESLDWLRDQLGPAFEQKAAELLKDPWTARNEYISVILDRSPENLEQFFSTQSRHALQEAEKITVLKLMELQRHAMLMYTSCGWFFDEISGLESVQVVQYAARAIQLARETLQEDFEPGFLDHFQHAKSNILDNGDGRRIYEKFVQPATIDTEKAAAHYAISSVFQDYAKRSRVFSYTFEDQSRELLSAGKTKLAGGQAKVTSEITSESDEFAYAILYLGEHNLTGAVRKFASPEEFERAFDEIKRAYNMAEFPQVIRLIDDHFGRSSYSLKSLFKDEQRRILNEILASAQDDLESRFRLITERYTPLMHFLRSAGAPLPPALQTASEFILHHDLLRMFWGDTIDLPRLRVLLEEAQQRAPQAIQADLSYQIKNWMERQIEALARDPNDLKKAQQLEAVAAAVLPIPIGLNLWKVQNRYWTMIQELRPIYQKRAEQGDAEAENWIGQFASLGQRLGFASAQLERKVVDEQQQQAA